MLVTGGNMKKAIIFATFSFVIAAAFAVPKNHECPLCTGTMMWTGETASEWGKLTYKMKCPYGHVSWEVDEINNSSYRNNNDGNACQYDGSSMYFTGKTKSEWGKLLKEYKCPYGHAAWRSQ